MSTETARNEPEPAADAASDVAPVDAWDVGLLLPVLALMGIGTVMVYAATINQDTFGPGGGAAHLRDHLLHTVLGLVVLGGGMYIPYRVWRRWTYPILIGVAALLLLVFPFGHTAGHATRWLSIAGFSVQPAETAKLAFIIFLAYSLAKKGDRIRHFTVAFIPHALVCGGYILLCLAQPDFGTCLILVALMFTMLFAAGTRLAYISLAVCVGGFLTFQAIAHNDMRLRRVLAYIEPWAHRSDDGYQMVQSMIAIGSGGLSGQGLGYGGQTLTGYLPEGHTDFILAVLAEQLGFAGVAVVVVLFAMLLVRGISTALHARDDFGRFLAFGLTLLLGMQAVINMLVATALVPTKGLTLPFVSYGGSSLLVCCLAAGMLLNIQRDVRRARLEPLVDDEAGARREGSRRRRPRRQRRPRRGTRSAEGVA